MTALYTLSESDVDVLRRIVHMYRNMNSLQKKRWLDKSQTANDIYIAKVTSEGIQALSDTTPGSAVCDIYRIDPLTPSITEVGIEREIFNVSEDEIEEGYVPVLRTKGGPWIASGVPSEESTRMKKFCRWIAEEDFTQEDEWWWATIEVQYGPGTAHTEGGTGTGSGTSGISIKVYNLLRHDGSSDTYEFYADEGDRGTAFWHQEEEWICILPECP